MELRFCSSSELRSFIPLSLFRCLPGTRPRCRWRRGGCRIRIGDGNSPPGTGRTVQITRGWKCKLQLMVRRKPRPYRAAERRQIVATAEGRGRVSFEKSATEWRKSSKESFAPTVLMTHLYRKPRPSAVATICRRSAARIGGASRDILHLTWTVLPF